MGGNYGAGESAGVGAISRCGEITKCGEITVSGGICKSAQNDEKFLVPVVNQCEASLEESTQAAGGSTLEKSEVHALVRSTAQICHEICPQVLTAQGASSGPKEMLPVARKSLMRDLMGDVLMQ